MGDRINQYDMEIILESMNTQVVLLQDIRDLLNDLLKPRAEEPADDE